MGAAVNFVWVSPYCQLEPTYSSALGSACKLNSHYIQINLQSPIIQACLFAYDTGFFDRGHLADYPFFLVKLALFSFFSVDSFLFSSFIYLIIILIF